MKALKIGEDVLAADGSRLGTVDRLVVDEGAHQVTHLVVEDRVLPLSAFRDAGADGLATRLDRAGLEAFPRHDESSLEAPGEHWEPPEGYQLHNFLAVAGALLGNTPYLPPVHADLTPGETASEITAGSPVWTGDRQIGHVIEVLTDEKGNVRELVMAREGVLGAHVVIPLEKVIEVVGSNVQVDLNETDVDLLEPFRPAPDR
ncbi:MAG: PRC-barrel domain-containing protein [Candidatus Dormibacteraeota bacterium]|nr:PRC-barrel domain-containing protein [Candidatus Dormibacteraeota bacterium]